MSQSPQATQPGPRLPSPEGLWTRDGSSNTWNVRTQTGVKRTALHEDYLIMNQSTYTYVCQNRPRRQLFVVVLRISLTPHGPFLCTKRRTKRALPGGLHALHPWGLPTSPAARRGFGAPAGAAPQEPRCDAKRSETTQCQWTKSSKGMQKDTKSHTKGYKRVTQRLKLPPPSFGNLAVLKSSQ